jgi:hypothetical protein
VIVFGVVVNGVVVLVFVPAVEVVDLTISTVRRVVGSWSFLPFIVVRPGVLLKIGVADVLHAFVYNGDQGRPVRSASRILTSGEVPGRGRLYFFEAP